MTGSLCSLPLNSFRHDRLHWVVNENSISPTSAIHDRQIQPDHWMAAMGPHLPLPCREPTTAMAHQPPDMVFIRRSAF
jgi:hypothetical protein